MHRPSVPDVSGGAVSLRTRRGRFSRHPRGYRAVHGGRPRQVRRTPAPSTVSLPSRGTSDDSPCAMPTLVSSVAGGTSRPMFLPRCRSRHIRVLAASREIYNAEDIDKAQLAIKAFEIDYGARYPKAVAEIADDAEILLEFYKYPAEHWVHLRTTNPIESTFATVRLRTRVTKGPGSRAAGVAMAYKLIEAAQARWRAVNAPHLVALVRAGAVFHKGKLLERPIDITPPEPSESTETEVA